MMRRILIAFVCTVLASGSTLACLNDSETDRPERDYQESCGQRLVDNRETRQIMLTLLDKRIVVLAGAGGVMLATGVFFALRRREDRSVQ